VPVPDRTIPAAGPLQHRSCDVRAPPE